MWFRRSVAMLVLAALALPTAAHATDPPLGTGQHGTFTPTGPTLGPNFSVAMKAGETKTFNLSYVVATDGYATATLSMVMVFPNNAGQNVNECGTKTAGAMTCPAWVFKAPSDGTYTFNVRYLSSTAGRSSVNWEVKVDHPPAPAPAAPK